MTWTVVLLAQAAGFDAAVVQKGAELYRMNCAVAFCHGSAGAAGRAPALAGRNFEPRALRRAIARGIPARGMPAFQKQLGNRGVDAVFAYVRSLKGSAVAPANAKLPREAAAGRDLFFDSSRFPGCSDCHAAGNMGATVAAKLTSIAGIDALRGIRAINVRTAQVHGEREFPAIVAQEAPDSIRLFDLSSPLPVLRTLPKSHVTLKDGSTWTHDSAVARYTERELELIIGYIRAVP